MARQRRSTYLLDGPLSGARLILSRKRKTAAADLQPTFDGVDLLAYGELFAMDLLPACAKVWIRAAWRLIGTAIPFE
jgi:hypothetical protein